LGWWCNFPYFSKNNYKYKINSNNFTFEHIDDLIKEIPLTDSSNQTLQQYVWDSTKIIFYNDDNEIVPFINELENKITTLKEVKLKCEEKKRWIV